MATEYISREVRRKYRWPEVQLNLWIFVILAAASTVLGIFAWFIVVQDQLEVGIPWYADKQYPPQDATTDQEQALSFRHRYGIPDSHFPPYHTCTGSAADADTWGYIARLFYPLRPVVDDADRNIDTIVRTKWECQLKL